MSDIVLMFMKALRGAFEGTPVLMNTAAKQTTNEHIQLGVKRWIQTPIGSEVTLTTTYVPNAEQPMPQMLEWLQAFYAFIQHEECVEPNLSWQGKTADFLIDPLRIQCDVVLRYEMEVA